MILYRNIILFAISLIFMLIISVLSNYLYNNKISDIKILQKEQTIVNEKFITASILAKKLKKVYTLFETNLALDKEDYKNKESNMIFLKNLTDIIEKLEIKLIQIEPGLKKKKGLLTFIPYDMSIECDFEKLGQFVTALESDERLITIEEINIKNGTEKIKSNNRNSISNMNIILSINTITINKSRKDNNKL